MAEKVSRQTGHCMAGEAGLPGWPRLWETTGEAGGEMGGESVRSMVSSGPSTLKETSWRTPGLPGSGELLEVWSSNSSSVVSPISMSSSCS